MSPQERLYAETLNLYGSDIEPPEIDALFDRFRLAAGAHDAPEFAAQEGESG